MPGPYRRAVEVRGRPLVNTCECAAYAPPVRSTRWGAPVMSAYLIFMSRMLDAEKYGKYIEAAGPTGEGFDMKVLVFTDETTAVEGTPPYPRCVMLEFPDRETLESWYKSPAYQAI